MSRLGDVGGRLYRGDVSINFVGRQKIWYTISGCIVVIAVVALAIRGLNFSVDFKGGSVFTVKAPNASISQIQKAVADGGGGTVTVQKAGVGTKAQYRAQTESLSIHTNETVQDSLARELGIPKSQISTDIVGPTWGSQISSKAIEALIAFLIVIVIYLSIAFEWKMAAAAFIALLHDILITVGVYALAGFQVSPATITGLLTILGYSLYDTVVVFDKVRENTAGLTAGGNQRTTYTSYSDAANLALNQTLVRSINTSLIALLPVTAILIASTVLLPPGELSDLALVLFVGMLSGTYSSIFIATPVLADLKEREPKMKQLRARASARAASPRLASRSARTEAAVGAGPAGPAAVTSTGGRAIAPGRAGPGDDPDDYGDETPGPDAAVPDAGADEAEGAPATTARSAARRADGTRSVSRQQPRRSTAAQRRSASNRKKRR
jgi:preprotein translocase subunit SecF